MRLPVVWAHCDIPCGVYSGEPAKIAALAAAKMVDKITDLPMNGSKTEMTAADNNFTRMVLIKEREAQRCKDELLILWTDYFKPEHQKNFPDLHDRFWQAAKQCSVVKRGVDRAEAKKLLEQVEFIATKFDQAEAAAAKSG